MMGDAVDNIPGTTWELEKRLLKIRFVTVQRWRIIERRNTRKSKGKMGENC
jgi:hypothetical protein